MPDKETTNPATQISPPPKARMASFPVLVIDDNPADRKLTIIQLAEVWPFEHTMAVETAADGKEALDKMRTKRFGLIVLDWKLPKVGGGEVLRTMRQIGVRIPVIVVSGLQREDISDDLEGMGAAFLNKNEMDPTTLRDAIAVSLKLLGLGKPSAS